MKQKITLIVLAALFMAANGFAQGKTIGLPLSQKQASAALSGGNIKQQAPQKMLLKQQCMEQQNGFRAAVKAHDKLNGKELNKAKKRQPAFGTDRIISLADIAMYTDEEEVPLRQVLNNIKAKEEALMKAMEPVAQEMYASAQAAQQQAQQPGGASEPPKADEPKKEKGGDDVVDADFTMK